jgi:hypothetical protein
MVELCGEIETSLMIATTGLPDVLKGYPYDFSLVPLGGSREGYTFELAGGTLPSGLELDAQGRLHGTPEVEGTFAISVRVTDSAHDSSTEEFALKVAVPQRWRVAREEGGMLYMQDSLTPNAARVPLHRVLEYDVSSDNSHVAYVTYDMDGDGEPGPLRALYVVELSGDQPTPVLLATRTEGYIPHAWSPDSKRLAFTSDAVYSADFSQATPQIVHVADTNGVTTPEWETNVALSYWSDKNGYRFSTFHDGAFSAPRTLTEFEGEELPPPNGNQIETSWFQEARWYDFDSGTYKDVGEGTISPELGYWARSTPDAWQVLTLTGTQIVLSSLPATTKSEFYWHGDRALFAVNDQLNVWRHGSAGGYSSSLCVDGLPSAWDLPLRDVPSAQFSPDGTWFVLPRILDDESIVLSAVGIEDGRTAPPSDVASSTPARKQYLRFSFSRDSRWLATFAYAETQEKLRGVVHLKALGAGVEHTVEEIELPDGLSAQSYQFANGSSQLLIATAAGRYIVDLHDEQHVPQLVKE